MPRWQVWGMLLLRIATSWNGNALLFFYLRRRLPGYENTLRRVLLAIGLSVAFTVLTNFPLTWLTRATLEPSLAYWPAYWKSLLGCLRFVVLATSLYESVYFFYEWRHTARQAAGFARESAVARFEALKQQVDPHFLFNSLNTLAGLVGDNEPAQEFLGSLASVYRYVLLSKDHATVPLSQEMAFVDDYLNLTAIRFGSAVQVAIHLAPDALRQHVPPLVVQLLIENALKHNAISEKSPLLLTIHAAGDVLSVRNSLHHKTVLAQPTRQGLQNIVARYQFITDRPVLITPREREFEVCLPLLPAA
ncbi:MAG: histidine kinase [Hymenobacter sp.]|nr:MAG: histidine kinase [Hymenobacter sp.]